jgi:hypothetical protein
MLTTRRLTINTQRRTSNDRQATINNRRSTTDNQQARINVQQRTIATPSQGDSTHEEAKVHPKIRPPPHDNAAVEALWTDEAPATAAAAASSQPGGTDAARRHREKCRPNVCPRDGTIGRRCLRPRGRQRRQGWQQRPQMTGRPAGRGVPPGPTPPFAADGNDVPILILLVVPDNRPPPQGESHAQARAGR